jgi:hypothetical protein
MVPQITELSQNDGATNYTNKRTKTQQKRAYGLNLDTSELNN